MFYLCCNVGECYLVAYVEAVKGLFKAVLRVSVLFVRLALRGYTYRLGGEALLEGEASNLTK